MGTFYEIQARKDAASMVHFGRSVDLLPDALSLCLDVINDYEASCPTLPASPPTTPSDAS